MESNKRSNTNEAMEMHEAQTEHQKICESIERGIESAHALIKILGKNTQKSNPEYIYTTLIAEKIASNHENFEVEVEDQYKDISESGANPSISARDRDCILLKINNHHPVTSTPQFRTDITIYRKSKRLKECLGRDSRSMIYAIEIKRPNAAAYVISRDIRKVAALIDTYKRANPYIAGLFVCPSINNARRLTIASDLIEICNDFNLTAIDHLSHAPSDKLIVVLLPNSDPQTWNDDVKQ